MQIRTHSRTAKIMYPTNVSIFAMCGAEVPMLPPVMKRTMAGMRVRRRALMICGMEATWLKLSIKLPVCQRHIC